MIKPELHYYDLAEDVVAFSSTRHGGVGKEKHGEFSVNLYCGDDEESVAANRKALAEHLGIDESRLIIPHQVHHIESRRIASELFSLPESVKNQILEGVDAVMTDERGICIGVSTADCIPVLLYDEAHHAAAAIHAGWRGTLNHIVMKIVREMTVNFGSNPKEIKAIIGPGISLENFEVGQEVYDQFAAVNFDMNSIAKLYPVKEKKEGELPMKWHIDLKLCNRMDLEMGGVSPENIIDEGICTYTSSDDYFSARKLGVESGRIYNAILMK